MTPDLPDDPVVQVQRRLADARQAFAMDVDAILTEIYAWSLMPEGDHAGESRADFLRQLRAAVLEKFDQRLSLRSSADPVLVQLVREAFELLNDDDTRLDRKDWSREAKKWLMEG